MRRFDKLTMRRFDKLTMRRFVFLALILSLSKLVLWPSEARTRGDGAPCVSE
jgi:hypothetical protein